MTTIAVMQPYFIPYAGYFRLFAAADVVALFDCVQFPRRGWVHRNRLKDRAGELRWLTLALAKRPRDTAIAAMAFAPDAPPRLERDLARFIGGGVRPAAARLVQVVKTFDRPFVGYLEGTLAAACGELGLPFRTVRTSELGIDPALKGAERVIAVARALGAKRYLNAPGGRALYDAGQFARNGLELRFLPEWTGEASSILQRLLDEEPAAVADEIRRGL